MNRNSGINTKKATRLLLVQIKNRTIFNSFEITNKDFRKYRNDLLIKYPDMKNYLKKEFFDFDKIWPNWIDMLSWMAVEINMSLEYIRANINTPTTTIDGEGTPEKIVYELNKAKRMGFPYTHVGFGIYPVGYSQFIECAKSVKAFDPQIITIAGNIGSMVDDTKHYVDYVFLGDGVKSLRSFFGEDVNRRYKVELSLSEQTVQKGVKWLNFVTKLGCPEKCNFCMSSALFSHKHTPPLVTPKEVYDAVVKFHKGSKDVLGLTACEPNFLTYRNWSYELFELFEGYPIPIGFGGPATAKSLKKFDFERITNSSLHFSFVNVGIESFSEQYSKNSTFNETKMLMHKLRGLGVGVIGTFIVGFEEQTRESIMEELKLLTKLDCLFYFVQNLKAYPGTEVWDKLKESNKLLTDIPYDFFSISGFQAFKHPHFKVGFEDMLPLLRDIYKYIMRESGPEVLNIIGIYENKPNRKLFPRFEEQANIYRKLCKNLFPSWKKYLDPTDEQIERYLNKINVQTILA